MKSHISLLLLIGSARLLACWPLCAAKPTTHLMVSISAKDQLEDSAMARLLGASEIQNITEYKIGAELMGYSLLPSYVETDVKGVGFPSGVNYASAAAGILNDTGYRFGRIIPLGQQVSNFRKTVAQLRGRMQEELSSYLERALEFMAIGSNDYVNNYLRPQHYVSSHTYDPQQFNDLLIKLYRQQILEIQNLGLRKFFIAETSPAGCIPILLSNGECDRKTNNLLGTLNTQLRSLIRSLKSDYPGSVFMTSSSFDVLFQIRNKAEAYGFKVIDEACCGKSKGDGVTKPECDRNSVPCGNRDYMFWDAAHPTEATDRILAHIIYNTTSSE